MRAIAWYLVLVGLPAAALVGILKLGEGLEPPHAVHGTYAVAFDSGGTGHCLAALLPDEQRHLVVSQSGQHVEMLIGTLELHGTITGDSVRAAAPVGRNALIRAANCLTSDTLVIAAALAKTANETRLTATATFLGCASCSAIPVIATRLTDRERGG